MLYLGQVELSNDPPYFTPLIEQYQCKVSKALLRNIEKLSSPGNYESIFWPLRIDDSTLFRFPGESRPGVKQVSLW